jgi:hypothetical protein
MRKLVVALIGLLVCAQVLAAGVVASGKVVQIRIDQDGRGMVIFDQSIGGTPPTCVHPAYTNALSFNTTTGGGKGIMAMAPAAKTTGAIVVAYGTGACTIYGGAHVEDWAYGVSQ